MLQSDPENVLQPDGVTDTSSSKLVPLLAWKFLETRDFLSRLFFMARFSNQISDVY